CNSQPSPRRDSRDSEAQLCLGILKFLPPPWLATAGVHAHVACSLLERSWLCLYRGDSGPASEQLSFLWRCVPAVSKKILRHLDRLHEFKEVLPRLRPARKNYVSAGRV